MVEMLLERFPDATVSSLDLVQRHFPDKLATGASRKWSFYSADLTSLESLSSAFRQAGATCVFHTASPWTGSGADVCEKVNVQGTQTVVDACVKEGVKKLVFTSSAGTVYDGIDLINVDERMPFPKKPIDPYNATKVCREYGLLSPRADTSVSQAKAEQIVLEANGKNGLLTVALRPAGIFGCVMEIPALGTAELTRSTRQAWRPTSSSRDDGRPQDGQDQVPGRREREHL